MIITMMKPVEIDIKPGDDVVLRTLEPWIAPRRTTVRRITVRDGLTYVVFSNHTWRPITSYGRTWKKVEE